MPDISMCLNQKCSIRKQCYRFTAQPSEIVQSYTAFLEENKESCYIPNKKLAEDHLEFYNISEQNIYDSTDPDIAYSLTFLMESYAQIRVGQARKLFAKEKEQYEEELQYIRNDNRKMRQERFKDEAELNRLRESMSKLKGISLDIYNEMNSDK